MCQDTTSRLPVEGAATAASHPGLQSLRENSSFALTCQLATSRKNANLLSLLSKKVCSPRIPPERVLTPGAPEPALSEAEGSPLLGPGIPQPYVTPPAARFPALPVPRHAPPSLDPPPHSFLPVPGSPRIRPCAPGAASPSLDPAPHRLRSSAPPASRPSPDRD